MSPSCARILRYLGTCDGDMEKGSLRADVNVSVRKPGEPLGTRCEIKNVNSIRFIGQAIDHEARRQIDIHRGWRPHRPGDAAVRSRQGRDALDALQGGGARLSLFPRSRPAAAGIRPPPMSMALRGAPAGAAGREEGALRARLWRSRPTTPACWSANAIRPIISRPSAKGRDAKAAANWVINELFGRLNKEGMEHRGRAGRRRISSAPFSI